ncbi:MAG: hypothetical protein M1820_000131 [Bogoriella megaspora]|nr:MAG: hypothetical protein M1820_000131 [Bogoriella megaspora]
MSKEQATYSHGHHSSVVKSHSRRTAQNSAAFLLPYIQPTSNILDIGCGPGTITCDLASLAPQGTITGLDTSPSIITSAQDLATSRGLSNTVFRTGDANSLPFSDSTFDIVFAHQVLQHVGDPVGVLREMRRVTKPGGLVAARDADYKTFAWYPEPPALQKWGDLYQKVALTNGGQPNAGRRMHVWAREAGFGVEDTVKCGFDASWTYYGEAARDWGESWSERCVSSDFARSALERGLATKEDLEEISQAYGEWAKAEDKVFSVPCGEIICRVPHAT